MSLAGLSGAGIAAGLVSSWFGASQLQVDPSDKQQVTRGKMVYAEHCANCHGSNLEGQPNWRARKPDGRLPAPPHDASGHTWEHTDAQLFEITKKGVSALTPGYESDMPGFDSVISDQEIAAVLAYIQSTWPRRILEGRQNTNQSWAR